MEFVLPLGLDLIETPTQPFEEGYDVEWRDQDPPHYAFSAQVSVLRLERLVPAALACLPAFTRAVLEVRRPETELDADPDGPMLRRWVSGIVPRRVVVEVFRRYRIQLLHCGMAGFGAFDPESALEVFLDDHKLLCLWSPAPDPFERLLEAHRVPRRRDLPSVLDVEHAHMTLPEAADPARLVAARRFGHRVMDVEWFADAIRRRLGMRPDLGGGITE